MIRTNTAVWLPKYKRWQINVQKNGIRKTFTCRKKGRAGQRECNAKADRWLEENIIDSRLKVEELAEMYLEEKSMNVGTSRMATLKSRFRVWILPYIGKRTVSSLIEQDLQNILNRMYRVGRSKNMIDSTRQILCELMKMARRNRISTLNTEFIYTPNKAPRAVKRNSLTEEELAVLFSTDNTLLFGKEISDGYINHYRFAVATGLRRGELLGLKWSDIDGNIIHVRRSYNQEREFTDGKTTNACRDIPMTAIAENILKQIPQTSPYVFYTGHAPITLTQRFKAYAKYHGFGISTFHELRHTFITMMDSVVPINVLKSVVGHSEKMDTVGVYGHKNEREMNIAKDCIDDRFSNIIG